MVWQTWALVRAVWQCVEQMMGTSLVLEPSVAAFRLKVAEPAGKQSKGKAGECVSPCQLWFLLCGYSYLPLYYFYTQYPVKGL